MRNSHFLLPKPTIKFHRSSRLTNVTFNFDRKTNRFNESEQITEPQETPHPTLYGVTLACLLVKGKTNQTRPIWDHVKKGDSCHATEGRALNVLSGLRVKLAYTIGVFVGKSRKSDQKRFSFLIAPLIGIALDANLGANVNNGVVFYPEFPSKHIQPNRQNVSPWKKRYVIMRKRLYKRRRFLQIFVCRP